MEEKPITFLMGINPWIVVEPHPTFGGGKFLGGEISHRKGVSAGFFEEILSIVIVIPVFLANLSLPFLLQFSAKKGNNATLA